MKKNLFLNVFVAVLAVLASATVFTSCKPEEQGTPADKTELLALVDECKTIADEATTDDYPQEAIDAFKKVLAAAQAALNNEEITQAQVDNLKVQLTEAKKTFLASAYGAIPEEALLLGLSFDEGEGTELTADGAKGLKAVLKGGPKEFYGENAVLPTFVEGKIGKAIHFSESSHLEIDRTSLGNDFEGSQLSIAAWVKVDKTKASNYIISYNDWHSWKFQVQDGGKPFFTVATDAGVSDMDNEADQSVKEGEWAHLVLVLDLKKDHLVHMYVNGVNTKTWKAADRPALGGSKIVANDKEPLLIGLAATYESAYNAAVEGGWDVPTKDSWTAFFDGAIDELKVYNIALEDGQVSKLYNDENK